MELKLINDTGKPASKLAASDELFGREYNEALVHQVLRQGVEELGVARRVGGADVVHRFDQAAAQEVRPRTVGQVAGEPRVVRRRQPGRARSRRTRANPRPD